MWCPWQEKRQLRKLARYAMNGAATTAWRFLSAAGTGGVGAEGTRWSALGEG